MSSGGEQTLTPSAASAAQAAADVRCSHCGLPVPRGLIEPGAELQFCCSGCRAVYAVLHQMGLQRYYDLADEASAELPPGPAQPTGRGYEELDDEAFAQLHCRDVGDEQQPLQEVELYLEGVHCSACVWLVERLPAVVSGVSGVRLQLQGSRARVRWDPDAVKLSAIARTLDAMGYPVHPYRGLDLRAVRRREDRRMLVRLAVAGAAAGNVMLMAFALYSEALGGMAPGFKALFRWASLAISLPAVLWAAAPFYRGALAGLRARALHMDLPITIGIVAGFSWSTINTLRGAGEVYFESITALIFLLLVGRFIQRRQQRLAFDAAQQLLSLAPSSARRVEGETVREVPVEALLPGQQVEVLAGDTVPVDGVVLEGRSRVDASLLTGESVPVALGSGDTAFAGTLNLGARLLLQVAATGEQTRVGRLMRQVEQSAQRRAPIVLLADRIAGAFVATVLGLALVTLAGWLLVDASRALDAAMALLIVTCPCALGLATPLAVSAAVGRAARQGILIKGGDVLERLARPGLMLLDKTGTLTEGRTRLVRWQGPDQVKPLVRALEAHSAHHVARALVSALDDGTPAPVAEGVRETPGGGIRGSVAGQQVAVGTRAFLASTGAAPAPWADDLQRDLAGALTPVFIAVEGQTVAAAAFGDPLRPDAAETLARLRGLGWQVGILSGDHPDVVDAVGQTLEVPPERRQASASPEDKLTAVEQATAAAGQRPGPVVMVGDGVNDAAALAAASVGVAVHGGAEASLAAADVFIDRPGLQPLLSLVSGARAAVGVIRRNLAFSLAYNLVGATLAILGIISPLVAAVLMPLSSLTVVTISYRSRTFQQPEATRCR